MKQTELHKAMTDEFKAINTVQAKFIEMYKSDTQKQIECDYLNFLKEKAKQGGKDSKASKEYRAKTQRIQKATKRPGILEAVFGENHGMSISIKQGKSGFEWVEEASTTEPTLPKDLEQIIIDYIAKHGETEGFADDIKKSAETLTALAQPYYA